MNDQLRGSQSLIAAIKIKVIVITNLASALYYDYYICTLSHAYGYPRLRQMSSAISLFHVSGHRVTHVLLILTSTRPSAGVEPLTTRKLVNLDPAYISGTKELNSSTSVHFLFVRHSKTLEY